LSLLFLGRGAGVEESLPLLEEAKGEAISWQWLGAPKHRVFPQYILLETSLWPYDLIPLIQGILEPSLELLQVQKSPSSPTSAESTKYSKSLCQSRHKLLGYWKYSRTLQ
jgi:hypothetical protein